MRMRNQNSRQKILAGGLAVCFLTLTACAKQGYSVITATGTTIGLSIGQDLKGTGAESVFGYKRAEFAFVPTNRSGAEEAGGFNQGARDSANVLMEFQYKRGKGQDGGIYQRLAIGDLAVTQTAAAVLFVRGSDGEVSKEELDALKELEAARANIMNIEE